MSAHAPQFLPPFLLYVAVLGLGGGCRAPPDVPAPSAPSPPAPSAPSPQPVPGTWGPDESDPEGATLAEPYLDPLPVLPENPSLWRTLIYGFGLGGFCAIGPTGVIVCWGGEYYEALDPPEGQWRSLAGGGDHCAVGHSGEGACWGDPVHLYGNEYSAESLVPQSLLVSVDSFHAEGPFCWITREHVVECVPPPPPGETTNLISAIHGLTQVRTLGHSEQGVVVIDLDGRATAYPRFDNLTGFPDLAGRFSDWAQECGLTVDGDLRCWPERGVPPEMSFKNHQRDLLRERGPFVRIVERSRAICGVRADQSVDCVDTGRLENDEDPTFKDWPLCLEWTPVPDGPWLDLVPDCPGCGVRLDGTVECWGCDNLGWNPKWDYSTAVCDVPEILRTPVDSPSE